MNGALLFPIIMIASLMERAPLFNDLPADPHAFFNNASGCAGCHLVYPKENAVLEHDFDMEINEFCYGCHDVDELGRSHPVSMSKDNRYPDMIIPDNLPLDRWGNITCGTCHNPHLSGFAKMPIAPKQEPTFYLAHKRDKEPFYKSFYLRLEDPEKDYTQICVSCHEDH